MWSQLVAGQPQPWCIAHRGFSASFPENTHAAFEAALAEPIQAMELDIQLSRDRVPVIYHNRTLNMVGGGRRRVHTQTLAGLRAYDFGGWFDAGFEREALALLDEVLGRYGQRTILLLELKVRDKKRARLEQMMAICIDLVRRHDLAGRCYLLCFDAPLLAYGHSLAPDLRYVLNQDAGKFLARAEFLHAYSVAVGGLNAAMVRRAQAAGKPVLTFTCNDEKQLARAMACGVDGIMSNDPHWLAGALARPRPPG